jgi:hypothetical protein
MASPSIAPAPRVRTVQMRVVAQDPSLRTAGGDILTAVIDVPAEELAVGPRGYRVQVVDYDASARCLYPPLDPSSKDRWVRSSNAAVPDSTILEDPRFHARNVYALVMSTLARFEFALGRRVSWGFASQGHQIKVAPHAFCDANAFYSQRDESLLFGYFPASDGKRTVFTCLSHDVVVHETAHGLLDGLRNRYVEPSSMDQAGFHEGFADIVALLSVLAQREIVAALMDRPPDKARRPADPRRGVLSRADASAERLRRSTLFAMAEELGKEMSPIGRSALRHSPTIAATPEVVARYTEAHDRGEILVAALLNAFIEVWAARLAALFRDPQTRYVDRDRAAEEGARTADYLLTVAIRALDYAPTVHLEFSTYLSAMLTADREVRPTDDPPLRRALLRWFRAYQIRPASPSPDGVWLPPALAFSFDRSRYESMQRDPDEVFKFVWENRKSLSLDEAAYTRVISVRPCFRFAPDDGFVLRETVAEVLQQISLTAGELGRFGIASPAGMPPGQPLMLFGGATLVFDEYGRVKYAIGDRVFDRDRPQVQQRQTERLASLWRSGFYSKRAAAARRFASIHRRRALGPLAQLHEEW